MKKKLFFGLIFVWSCVLAYPQQALMYQVVLRDDAGVLLSETPVQIKVSIKDSLDRVVYTEDISTKTNSNGLATFLLGTDGTTMQIRTDFKAIAWKEGKFFIKLENNGGTAFELHDYKSITAVPWAFAAFDAAGDLDDRIARIEAYLRSIGLIP